MKTRPLSRLDESRWGPSILGEEGGPDRFVRTLHRREGEWLVQFESAAYVVRNGSGRLVGFFPSGERPSQVRNQLRGPVLALQWHNRGALVLHASAVLGPQGVVALVGERGAGKSTLAACAIADGADPWADDVVPVGMDGTFAVPRVSARLRLHPDVWDVVRHSPPWTRTRPRPLPDGKLLSGALPARRRTAPLASILLVRRHSGDDTFVQPVGGAARLRELAPHLYLRALVGRTRDDDLARKLLMLAASVPVHRLLVPARLEAARHWWSNSSGVPT